MTRWVRALMVVLALAGPGTLAAQGEDGQGRRDRLEAQVRERFLEQASARLELTAAQRPRLAALLEEGAVARRGLLRESMEVRRRLVQATRDSTTTPAAFEALLGRVEELTRREHALERREQERLAEILTPRQRAGFLLMRMRFNEQVRELRGRGPAR